MPQFSRAVAKKSSTAVSPVVEKSAKSTKEFCRAFGFANNCEVNYLVEIIQFGKGLVATK